MPHRIYKNSIKENTSNSLFKYILRVCNFYSPKIFDKQTYPKTWTDPEFVSRMILLRKDKEKFSSIYDTVQLSNELIKISFENNLQKIASNYLKINEKNLSIRDVKLRMDFPNDTRNSYNWHQDSAYDKFNLNSNNGVVLWIPLIDTNKKNGTLVIKPGSEYSSFNCSKRVFAGDKYPSVKIIVINKYLKKYPSKSVEKK